MALDVDDTGTDAALVRDLPLVSGIVDGPLNVAMSLARRLDCPAGGLVSDADYGFDLRGALNSIVNDAMVPSLRSRIETECLKDPRVLSASAQLKRGSLKVPIQFETAAGSFSMVVESTAVSTELLSFGGQAVAEVLGIPIGAVRLVQGPKGDAGIGTPGGSSSGTNEVALDDSRLVADDSGNEVMGFDWAGVDFDDLPASITARVVAEVKSASGTATFRLRVGGTVGAVDGTVIATLTTSSAVLVASSAAASSSGNTGRKLVKLTMQASGAGAECQLRAPVVTFR